MDFFKLATLTAREQFMTRPLDQFWPESEDERQEREIRERNEAAVQRHIREYLDRQESPR